MISQKIFYFQKIIKNLTVKNIIKYSSTAKRINESDPKDHCIKHVGSLYKIPENDFTTCYEFLIKDEFTRLLKAFDDRSIIVRNPALEVINYMKLSDLNKPIVRYMFYGKIGSGKTVQMAHVTHYVHLRNDWLLLNFPNVFDFLHLSPELITHSKYENLFDTPTLSGMWLKSFLNMNSQFLSKYKLKTLKTIEWNQKEYLAEGSDWLDMINFAISRPKYTSDCIGILLREAREHAKLKEFKILGIIKGINCLYQTSRKADINSQFISAERISVLNYLRRFLRNDWYNGAIICSVNQELVYDKTQQKSFFPKYLLGEEALKELDPFVPVNVDSYTNADVTNYLHFLYDNNWLTVTEAKDPYGIGRKEITFLADNRPEELFNVTREW